MPAVATLTERALRAAVLDVLREGLGEAAVTTVPPELINLEPDPSLARIVGVAIPSTADEVFDGRRKDDPPNTDAISQVAVRAYVRTVAGARGAAYDEALDLCRALKGLLLLASPELRTVRARSSVAVEGEWYRVDVTCEVQHRAPMTVS